MAERKAPKIKPPVDPESEAWNKIPWRKLERHCFRIQKRIYQASQRGESRKVQKLQKLLMKSEAARLLAVRRVTQENQGKKTAGVDGVKSVKPQQRQEMAKAIHPACWKRQRAKSVQRVWIPKPGKAEQRPLGIPSPTILCVAKNRNRLAWSSLLISSAIQLVINDTNSEFSVNFLVCRLLSSHGMV